jgi:hypothetical protein
VPSSWQLRYDGHIIPKRLRTLQQYSALRTQHSRSASHVYMHVTVYLLRSMEGAGMLIIIAYEAAAAVVFGGFLGMAMV